MVKSGLIFGAVMFVVALGITLVLPYCIPCVALLIGLAAGYVAGVFGKFPEKTLAVRSGAIAGAIAGVGVILGEMVGALINVAAVNPQQVMDLMQKLGITGMTLSRGQYIAAQLGVNLCLSLVSVALMAGLGALGGLLWWNMNEKKQVLPPPTTM